mmetsp:Transcript_10671/g.13849  ORF Transcript_10671/g.13849 Transcript_10671/m.13849 type:complete len:911 (+) Transcript_10671:222-2954(+)
MELNNSFWVQHWSLLLVFLVPLLILKQTEATFTGSFEADIESNGLTANFADLDYLRANTVQTLEISVTLTDGVVSRGGDPASIIDDLEVTVRVVPKDVFGIYSWNLTAPIFPNNYEEAYQGDCYLSWDESDFAAGAGSRELTHIYADGTLYPLSELTAYLYCSDTTDDYLEDAAVEIVHSNRKQGEDIGTISRIFETYDCPTESDETSLEDVLVDINAYNTEKSDGNEQLVVVVPYNLAYNVKRVQWKFFGLDEDTSSVSGFWAIEPPARAECVLSDSIDLVTEMCLSESEGIFQVSHRDTTCPGQWQFARIYVDLPAWETVGFSKVFPPELNEIDYIVKFAFTVWIEEDSLFGSEPVERYETIIRQITLTYTTEVSADLDPQKIFGKPIVEIFTSYWVRRTGDLWGTIAQGTDTDTDTTTAVEIPDQIGDVLIKQCALVDFDSDILVSYPYVGVRAWYSLQPIETDPSNTFLIEVPISGDCSVMTEEELEANDMDPWDQLCEQVVEGRNLYLPVGDSIIYYIRIELECMDGSEAYYCTPPIYQYDQFTIPDTVGECYADIVVTKVLDAMLKAYIDIHADSASRNKPYTDPEDERAVFVYQSTIYYEMTISGLTGASAQLYSFEIIDQDEGTTLDFNIIYDLLANDPDYGDGVGQTTQPSVNMMKDFGSNHEPETLIFRQIVNEYTFPNYPNILHMAMKNYLIRATIQNLGFPFDRRELLMEMTASERALVGTTDLTTAYTNMGVGAMIDDADIMTDDDGSSDDSTSADEFSQGNDQIETRSSEAKDNIFLFVGAGAGAVVVILAVVVFTWWWRCKRRHGSKSLEASIEDFDMKGASVIQITTEHMSIPKPVRRDSCQPLANKKSFTPSLTGLDGSTPVSEYSMAPEVAALIPEYENNESFALPTPGITD